jgi:hypothetical protein
LTYEATAESEMHKAMPVAIMCSMKYTLMPLLAPLPARAAHRLLPLCACALLLSACAVTELPPYNPDGATSSAPAYRPAPTVPSAPASGAISQPVPLTPEQAQQLQPSSPPDSSAPAPISAQPSTPFVAPPTTQLCDAGPAQFAVGQPYSPSLLAQVRERSQARGVRLLRPGDSASIGGNPQRANLVLDGDNKVASVQCG